MSKTKRPRILNFPESGASKIPLISQQDKSDINLKVDLAFHSGGQRPPLRDFRDVRADEKSISKKRVDYQAFAPDPQKLPKQRCITNIKHLSTERKEA